jgi:hypothetical protein
MSAAKRTSQGKAKAAAKAVDPLRTQLAAALGVDEDAVVSRALRELAERVGLPKAEAEQAKAARAVPVAPPAEAVARPPGPAAPAGPKPPPARTASTVDQSTIADSQVPHGAAPSSTVDRHLGHAAGLPKRLYVLLHGRGLDGMGLPVEVINFPCTIGSGRTCTVWVNAPNVETRHACITETDEGWVLEDMGSARGTFLADGERVARRVLQSGDSFLLANERMTVDIR